MPETNTDEFSFMRQAIVLAKKGLGRVNPNPLVGAVIVKDGIVIGEGYHAKYGDLHAERNAFLDCERRGENPEGATLYVTLEPCCHHGKQPPCTEKILEKKIAKVFVGSPDPNPLVAGKGIQFLRENGVEVVEHFLQDECDALNPVFFHYITTKMPYVTLKYAMTMDGKICTKSGESKWITNEDARKKVHLLRMEHSAILAGSGTVLKDDPLLNVRLEGVEGVGPVRVILDSDLKIPLTSRIAQTSGEIRTIVFCCKGSSAEKKSALGSLGLEVLEIPADSKGHPDFHEAMKVLGEKGIDSVLVEGGGEVNFSALESGAVKRACVFVGAKVFGGTAKSPVAGSGVEHVPEGWNFTLKKTEVFGSDVMLDYFAEEK